MPMVPILNYPDTDGARYSRTSVDLSIVATKTIANVTQQIAPALRIEGWTYWKYKRSLKPGKGSAPAVGWMLSHPFGRRVEPCGAAWPSTGTTRRTRRGTRRRCRPGRTRGTRGSARRR